MRQRQQSGAARFGVGLQADYKGAQLRADALPKDALPLLSISTWCGGVG